MKSSNFNHSGYQYLAQFFAESELSNLKIILQQFHTKWLTNYEQDYKNGLVNSHSITSSLFITQLERLEIFRFIFQEKLMQVINACFPAKPLFLNTQLFFNPFDSDQKNYWHRDGQYNGLSVDQQKESLGKNNIIHFRIPLAPELGIELIPGTHQHWDLQEEFETRLSLNGRKPSDDLHRGKTFPLNTGDLLLFSANMMHRGLYGKNRFSFDVIFCEDVPGLREFADPKNLPTATELRLLNLH